MIRFKALFLILAIITLTGCKKTELATEKYSGTWNYQTSDGCQSTFLVKAIDDNNITITYPTYCMYAATVKAAIIGNTITIPRQQFGTTSYSASGTITDNSMQFNSYRYSADNQYWVFKLTATK